MSRVSVVLSTYCRNRPSSDCLNLLKRAIDSVLGQTFSDFEFILIDDGSKDGSEAICREYAAKDSRIRLYRHNENSGYPAKRYNEGMKESKTDYFLFMFDDDFWFPNAIESLHGAITGEHRGCELVYGLVKLVDANTRSSFNFGGEWNLAAISEKNILANMSVIVTRKAIHVVGGYDESSLFKRRCDWDLWVRIGKKFPVARIPVLVGTCYYNNSDSIGATVDFNLAVDLEKIREIQKSENRRVSLQGEMMA